MTSADAADVAALVTDDLLASVIARVVVAPAAVSAAPAEAWLISRKHSLLLLAPVPLEIVSRPSLTATVTFPSNHRVLPDGVPDTASTPSARTRNTLSVWLGSPETI